MTDNDWINAPRHDDHTIGSYPFIQWVNGNPQLAPLHPVLGAGGFVMPKAQFGLATADGVIPDFFSTGIRVQEEGNQTESYLAAQLDLAVLAKRFRWRKQVSRGVYQYSVTYQPGFHGHLQLLVLVRALNTKTPVTFTLGGVATDSRHFGQVLNLFRKQVIETATSLAQRRYPQYYFWFQLKAGPRVDSGHGKYITPPVAAWDSSTLSGSDVEARKRVLHDLYLGSALIEQAANWWPAAQAWAKVWPSANPSAPDDPDERPIP